MGAAVAGTTPTTTFRPTASYTTLRDVTQSGSAGARSAPSEAARISPSEPARGGVRGDGIGELGLKGSAVGVENG